MRCLLACGAHLLQKRAGGREGGDDGSISGQGNAAGEHDGRRPDQPAAKKQRASAPPSAAADAPDTHARPHSERRAAPRTRTTADPAAGAAEQEGPPAAKRLKAEKAKSASAGGNASPMRHSMLPSCWPCMHTWTAPAAVHMCAQACVSLSGVLSQHQDSHAHTSMWQWFGWRCADNEQQVPHMPASINKVKMHPCYIIAAASCRAIRNSQTSGQGQAPQVSCTTRSSSGSRHRRCCHQTLQHQQPEPPLQPCCCCCCC